MAPCFQRWLQRQRQQGRIDPIGQFAAYWIKMKIRTGRRPRLNKEADLVVLLQILGEAERIPSACLAWREWKQVCSLSRERNAHQ